MPQAQPLLAMLGRVHGYARVVRAATGSHRQHRTARAITSPQASTCCPVLAAALQPANPGGSQRRRSSEALEARMQDEAPCTAAETGYLLASSIDFCRVEEINAVVVG